MENEIERRQAKQKPYYSYKISQVGTCDQNVGDISHKF